MLCSICFDQIPVHQPHGWDKGHNAEPVNSGRCCDVCNDNVVISARLMIMITKIPARVYDDMLREQYDNLRRRFELETQPVAETVK